MSLARRAWVAFATVLLVTGAASASTFLLARGSTAALAEFRTRASALDDTMWSLRSDFYNYDDQMNMYVAVLAGGGPKDDLAETTYQQAVAARKSMGDHLTTAARLTTDRGLLAELARLRQDYDAYNGFADRTRQAALAGQVDRAVFLSTRGNLEPSNDIMPTLDRASGASRAAAAVQLDRLERRQHLLELVSVVGAVLTALMVLGLAAGLRVLVLRRIGALRDAMVAIATGTADRSSRVAARGRDEIAQVGDAFNTMLDALAAQDAEIARAQTEREEQLSHTFEQQRQAEIQVRTRAQTVIDETAGTVTGDLRRLGDQVEVVRRGAGTIEQKVGAADEATRSVVDRAHQADQVVEQLQESLQQVAGMARLIAGVADQTKLLALNATIEAARAGEAGRGFSVVAGEVKALAMTTARSTEEITSTIATLEEHSTAVAAAIAAMTSGIGGVTDATGALREVAAEQFGVVAALDHQVVETIDRLEGMSHLTERLERRESPRVPAWGEVELVLDGTTRRCRLADVSEGGLRCQGLDGVRPQAGRPVQVAFELDGAQVRLHGTVVPHRENALPGELGVQFVDLPDDVRARLRRYVGAGSAPTP